MFGILHLVNRLKEPNKKDTEGVIIVFRNPKAKQSELMRFCRGLFGYKDYSNKGGYVYDRKGLLDEIRHIHLNPIRSAIIVKQDDAPRILEYLKSFRTEVYTRKVELTKEDLEKLGKP
ncbi:MAG: hypothetical protein Q8O41_11880 [Candidatus Methanoperedens sp.]|nr:hypothetical protein [Candidatus Methanoperedens sp.]